MGILEDILSAMSSSSSSNNDELKVGDWVHVISYGCDGEIIKIVGNKYYVDLDDDEEEEEDDTVDIFEKKDLKKLW